MKRALLLSFTALGTSIVASPALLAGCSDDDTVATTSEDAGSDVAASDAGDSKEDAAAGDSGPTTTDVSIKFKAIVGDKAFSCGSTYDGLGTASTSVKPVDFRFYVNNVRLLAADGTPTPITLAQDGKWQYQNVALLDFEDKTGACEGNADLNDVVHGTVPKGTYTGVAFTLGVPFALNHANQATAPAPLSITQMFWSWQAGYKFTKIDYAPEAQDGGALVRFNVHVGSAECDANPADGGTVTTCARPNSTDVSFATFDPATQAITVDYAALVAGTDLTNNPPPVPGCMSQGDAVGPQCDAIFPKLGIDMTTGQPTQGQSVFAVK